MVVSRQKPVAPTCRKRSHSSFPYVPNHTTSLDAEKASLGYPHPESNSICTQSTVVGRCCVCLEDKPVQDLITSGDICGHSECAETFCSSCFGRYVSELVSANRFTVPPITCLACHGRIPTSSWRSFADDTTFHLYEQNAQDALVLRCLGCDEMQCLAETNCLAASCVAKAIDSFVTRSSDADIIREAWSAFEMGKMGADQFLELLLTCGPPDIQDHTPEKRLAENGWSYTLHQFLEYYDDYKYTRPSNWYADYAWEWHGWYNDDENEIMDDATEEVFLCHVCGCFYEFDEVGDPVCWCDACKIEGCKHPLIHPNGDGECCAHNCPHESEEQSDTDHMCDSVGTPPMAFAIADSNIEMCVHVTIPNTIKDYQDLPTGKERWEAATLWSPARRLDETGGSYSLAQFELWYGQKDGRRKWKAAPISNITPILHAINDLERRTALQLAHLRKNPKICTPCCYETYCFRCHVGTWHSCISCEDSLANDLEVEVQFCPGCNVPTQRTKGCSSMTCPCGKNWHWENGSDVSDDDDY